MADPTYEEDKVYLRDVRTGEIYLYEHFLAANKNFEPYVPNPKATIDLTDGTENDQD